MTRIYLDNAATSWPKPESVYNAVDHYQRHVGATAGRSNYHEATQVERLVSDARRRVASLLGITDSNRLLFTLNGTDSLNMALHGLLRAGDHVVTTVAEHNSILRPLRFLESHLGIQLTHVPCGPDSVVDVDDVRRAIRADTRLIAMTHVSNVTGTIQPAEDIGRLARERNVLFLLDAAQSAGHIPIDVAALNVDLLATPGHKGLLGPLGVGVLYVAPGVDKHVRPLRQGGTGTHSENDIQPDSLPDRYESGNHNVPGIVGLGAGATFVIERGMNAIREHERRLTLALLDGFDKIDGVTIYGTRDANRQVGVVSITVQGYHPSEVASLLDASYSIQVRSGLHCAPRMHDALGSLEGGGTVRFSLGPFNTHEHVTAAIQAIHEIAGTPP